MPACLEYGDAIETSIGLDTRLSRYTESRRGSFVILHMVTKLIRCTVVVWSEVGTRSIRRHLGLRANK